MNHQRLSVISAALAAAGALLVAPPVGSASTGDPLGCSSSVFDPSGLVDSRVDAAVVRAEQALDADVRVRAERSVDGGLDARIDQLVRQCEGWAAPDGELADDMVVVLFSAAEREASVYYGADLGPDLEDRWSAAVDDMTAEFPADYSGGVVAALTTLRTGPSDGASSGSSSSAESSSSSGNGAPVLALLFIGALIVIGVVSQVRRRGAEGSSWGTFGYSDRDDSRSSRSSWSSRSTRRRRSSFGGLSSSSRSRSSRSRRSSSRGTRRAGGGTKKW